MPEDEPSRSVIIDHLVPTQVSEDIGFNELVTLHSLQLGLNLISITVWQSEEPLRREEEAAQVRSAHFGHRPGTDRRETLLRPCFFHWFGVSLCNYVRLVGFLAALKNGQVTRKDLEDKNGRRRIAAACTAYVTGVTEIQDVLIWGNKVAAHFAITDPRDDDNLVTLDMSVMYPVSYSDRSYRVGDMILARSTEGSVPMESQIPSWSITEVYERLIPRYWPSFGLPQAEAPTASPA